MFFLQCDSMKSKLFTAISGAIIIGVIALGFIWPRGNRMSPPDNIVLISIDTCRADHLSCYGYFRKTTPNIDNIAEEGVLFENVISPVPTTLPAHCTMHTGTIPPYHGVHSNEDYVLGSSFTTLAELLQENGFATAAFVGSFVMGSQFGLNQGFDVYNDHVGQHRSSIGMTERIAEETNAQAFDWMNTHHQENFFLFLHYFDPHFPYEAPRRFEAQMRSSFQSNTPYPTGTNVNTMELSIDYDAEISYVDHCIGQVIQELKRLGLYDSTLLVITADHGESLYEHKELTHSYYIYQSTIAVPLIFRLPGGPNGLRITDNAGLTDIVPTVCSLLDIVPPPVLHGNDLSPCILKKAYEPAERAFYAESFLPTMYQCSPLFSLLRGQYKYIQSTDPELYDLRVDPGELRNVIDLQPERARIMQEELRSIIENTRNEQAQSERISDVETITHLQSLGYVSGGMMDISFEFDQSKDSPRDMIEYHRDVANCYQLINTRQYEAGETLIRRLISQRPQLYINHFNLGTLTRTQGRLKECILHYQKAIELGPNKIHAYHGMGLALESLGKLDQAVDTYNKALEIWEHSFDVTCSLADVYGKQREFDQAIMYYQRALELKPDTLEVKMVLANTLLEAGQAQSAIVQYQSILERDGNNARAHYWLGKAFSSLDKLDRAAESYRKALLIKQDSFAATRALADTYYKQRDLDKAVTYYQRALQIKPDSLEVRKGLATTFLKTGQMASAVDQYHMILARDGDDLRALNDLAWLQATTDDDNLRDPQNAVVLAERACQISEYEMPEILDTLAAAYAAAGNFDQAVAVGQNALALSESAGNTELSEELKSSLELYMNDQPYHESH